MLYAFCKQATRKTKIFFALGCLSHITSITVELPSFTSFFFLNKFYCVYVRYTWCYRIHIDSKKLISVKWVHISTTWVNQSCVSVARTAQTSSLAWILNIIQLPVVSMLYIRSLDLFIFTFATLSLLTYSNPFPPQCHCSPNHCFVLYITLDFTGKWNHFHC